jgi:tetratricopeptide (TPR) repeat protein
MDERVIRAEVAYRRSVFEGEDDAVLASADRGLDAVEADLVLARGRIGHARFLQSGKADDRELPAFQRALDLYRLVGDRRGEAEALFWIGCYHQVVQGDDSAAAAPLERSAELAEDCDDTLTLSYALRHLGIADQKSGRLDAARDRLERSTRLRRDIDFLPGVAANLVGLGYLALAQGRRDEARALLVEAAESAAASNARVIVGQAREALALTY